MRNYEHFKVEPYGILLPDPKSAKAKWGLHTPEYLEPDDPDFLREGHSLFPQGGLVFQLTKPTPPIGIFHDKPYGDGMVIVEAQDYSGGYHECGMHKNKIEWK